jgi:hypothetical protein
MGDRRSEQGVLVVRFERGGKGSMARMITVFHCPDCGKYSTKALSRIEADAWVHVRTNRLKVWDLELYPGNIGRVVCPHCNYTGMDIMNYDECLGHQWMYVESRVVHPPPFEPSNWETTRECVICGEEQTGKWVWST